MKQGTVVNIPGHGEATVVYHNPDGYGIVWGRRNENLDIPPEAMLRNPYPAAIEEGLECVGEGFEIITEDS